MSDRVVVGTGGKITLMGTDGSETTLDAGAIDFTITHDDTDALVVDDRALSRAYRSSATYNFNVSNVNTDAITTLFSGTKVARGGTFEYMESSSVEDLREELRQAYEEIERLESIIDDLTEDDES